MRHLICYSFLCVALFATAQPSVVGDTTNMYVTAVNDTFFNETISFDIDCDGSTDIAIASQRYSSNYRRVWITSTAGVQIIADTTPDIVLLPHFHHWGEALSNEWSSAINWVHGTGGNGAFGYTAVFDQYLVARKVDGNDTSYLFVKMWLHWSLFGVLEIISTCNNSIVSIVGIQNIAEDDGQVYPNPAQNFIRFPKQPTSFHETTIYDIVGKRMYSYNVVSETEIDINLLPRGYYTLQVGEKKYPFIKQ